MQQVLEPFVLALGVSMQVILASLKLQFHFLKLLLVLQNLRTFALELITSEDVRVCVHTVKLEFIFPGTFLSSDARNPYHPLLIA